MNSPEITLNVSHNSTTGTKRYDVNVEMIVIGWLVLIWIILSNSAIIGCYLVNRRRIWPSFAKHVFTLTLSDFAVGILSVPALVNGMIDNVIVEMGSCSAVFYAFFFSQCACLYHIFGVCVHRCVRIQYVAIRGQESGKRFPVVLSITAWISSAVVISIPFLLWTDTSTKITNCVIQQIFVQYKNAILFLAVAYVVPLVLTNILYCVAIIRLKLMWKQVFPVIQEHMLSTISGNETNLSRQPPNAKHDRNNLRKHIGQNKSNIQIKLDTSESERAKDTHHKGIHAQGTSNNEPDGTRKYDPTAISSHHSDTIGEPVLQCDLHRSSKTKSNIDSDVSMHRSNSSNIVSGQDSGFSDQGQHGNVVLVPQHRYYHPDCRYSRSRIRMQRRVLGTIGFVTMLFNLFTIPLVAVMMLENRHDEQRSRNLRYAVCIAFLLNSSFNPFVYAYRTDWLKNNLRIMTRDWVNFCCQ